MIVKSYGVVLKQFPFSESSIIVKVLTREHGLVSLIVKGAKSRKGAKAALLRPINQVDISFYYKENKSLFTLKDCRLLFSPDALIFGIYKSAISSFIIEILNNTIGSENETDTYLYDFVIYSFDYLRNRDVTSHFHLSFLFQYAQRLGINISLSDKENQIFSEYENATLLSKTKRKEYLEKILLHYKTHIPNFKNINSLEIFEKIF